MKQKPIAIVFSDLHLNLWAKFNENNNRTLNQFKVLSYINELSSKYKVPILFCGDFFHKPEGIPIEILDMLDKHFKFNQDLVAISGNHDIKSVNSIDKIQYSLVKYLSNRYKSVKCIDLSSYQLTKGVNVYGVPYIDHNINLSEYLKGLDLDKSCKNILLLHTDYPGAKDTDDRLVDSVENLNLNILNRFDLVLCGHIHKPQRLSKKVWMVGAPNHQRRTDRDCDMGIWVLYNDLSLDFKPLDFLPKFIDVESDEDVKDDGNYYTVLPKKASIKENTKHKITKQLSKKSLARRYMKAKGIKDSNRESLLINILNKFE
jgi:DNA repair exonuclease SbcCD nuclease subunit